MTETDKPVKAFVFETQDAMSGFMIRRWAQLSIDSINKKGVFTVALSGGSTPIDFYRKLAITKGQPWDRTHIFFADERYVADTHEDSNYRLIKETLLDHVDIPSRNIHAVPTNMPGPRAAAEKYEKDIAGYFSLPPGVFPVFDLVLLGIGGDGHTASLFPGTPSLAENMRIAREVVMEGTGHDRITLTLPVINRAAEVIFMVSGRGKARVLKEVVEKRDTHLPASHVMPVNGNLVFLSDPEAASMLSVGRREEIRDWDR